MESVVKGTTVVVLGGSIVHDVYSSVVCNRYYESLRTSSCARIFIVLLNFPSSGPRCNGLLEIAIFFSFNNL